MSGDTEHRITGWKTFEVEIYRSRLGVRGIKEETTDVLDVGEWECSCGLEFEGQDHAEDHLFEVDE